MLVLSGFPRDHSICTGILSRLLKNIIWAFIPADVHPWGFSRNSWWRPVSPQTPVCGHSAANCWTRSRTMNLSAHRVESLSHLANHTPICCRCCSRCCRLYNPVLPPSQQQRLLTMPCLLYSTLLYSSLLIRLAAPPPRILRPEILIKSFLSAAQIPIKILLRSARSIRNQTPAPYEMWARSADYANSRSKLFQNYKSKFIHNMSMLGLCNRRWNKEWMWHVIKSKMWWFLCDVDNHT